MDPQRQDLEKQVERFPSLEPARVLTLQEPHLLLLEGEREHEQVPLDELHQETDRSQLQHVQRRPVPPLQLKTLEKRLPVLSVQEVEEEFSH